MNNNNYFKPRDIVKLSFQYQENKFIPYHLELSIQQKAELLKYYGDERWFEQITDYMGFITGVDNFLSLNLGVDNFQNLKRMSIQKDSFGCKWKLGEAHHLVEYPLHEPIMGSYKLPDLEKYFKFLHKKWPDDFIKTKNQFRIIAHSFGLFERAWSLRGFENFLMDLLINKEFSEELLEHITEWLIQSVDLMAGAPVDAIMFTDDHAFQKGMLMSEEIWRKLFKPRWKKIFEKVHHYGLYTIMHMCGNTSSVIPDLIEIGLDCMESCQPECMDIYQLKEKYEKNIRFWGGLGIQRLMAFGTPSDVRKEIKNLKNKLGNNGGYILSGAKPFGENIPIENIAAFIEEVNIPVF